MNNLVQGTKNCAVRCPECHRPISPSHVKTDCDRQDCQFERSYGVTCFSLSNFSFGEFGREEMRKMIDKAQTLGWRNAIAQFSRNGREILVNMVEDQRRIGFLDLLEPGLDETVVDFGCGYGGVAVSLAPHYGQVIGLDITLERVAILEIVKQQDGLNNVRTICHSDNLNLPFEDESIDALLLIGVLEYFPVSMTEFTAIEAQRRSLQEMARILKPGGRLYIATKNRFGWPYWKGGRDHNNLPFGPILPLWLAEILNQKLNARPYRIVNHSMSGYKRLLRSAGFSSFDFYWPVPGYQLPTELHALDKDRASLIAATGRYASSAVKRLVLSLLARLGLLPRLVPHFSIVARKLA